MEWQPWSPEAVAKLRAEGRIVYVDLTARWCATCQTNKKLVFGSDEVLKFFADKKIAALRADWTKQDPRITEALAYLKNEAQRPDTSPPYYSEEGHLGSQAFALYNASAADDAPK